MRSDPAASILASEPPPKARRSRKRETARSLGVYDSDRDILDQYLHEVSRTPLLTQAQEIAVARKVQAGDEIVLLHRPEGAPTILDIYRGP